MLWVKAFHVIFMVTWFAGLFYLPRLFVYHVDCTDEIGHDRFVVMERKLFAIMTLGAILTWFFGLWLLVAWHWPLTEHWLQVKLLLVVLLSGYHIHTGLVVKRLKNKKNQHSSQFFRWYNEVPALMLIAVVLLAVVRSI
jgi:putative membrane protein